MATQSTIDSKARSWVTTTPSIDLEALPAAATPSHGHPRQPKLQVQVSTPKSMHDLLLDPVVIQGVLLFAVGIVVVGIVPSYMWVRVALLLIQIIRLLKVTIELLYLTVWRAIAFAATYITPTLDPATSAAAEAGTIVSQPSTMLQLTRRTAMVSMAGIIGVVAMSLRLFLQDAILRANAVPEEYAVLAHSVWVYTLLVVIFELMYIQHYSTPKPDSEPQSHHEQDQECHLDMHSHIAH